MIGSLHTRNNYTVYKHTAPNGKVYIGITQQSVKNRWNYGNGYANNKHFTSAIKKYGWINIKHEILFENLTKEQAEQKEKELIAEYKSNDTNYGYNLDSGGNCNKEHSDETKIKIKSSLIGHEVSKETKEKLTNIYLDAFGKSHSIAEWSNITGIKQQTIWARVKRYRISVEEALRVKEFRGKQLNKRVVQLEKNGTKLNEYSSVTDASNKTGVNCSHIGECCKGKRKTAGGYVWKWFNDYTE